MPFVAEDAGDPPARRRRRILAVLSAVPQSQLCRAAELAPALREPLLIEDQRGMSVAGSHELLFQRAVVGDLPVVGGLKRDAPAAAVDPVVALDQLSERVPGGSVQWPDRIRRSLD
jgi:hypothetical protein